ncbi:IclR family transcriptional regulator [Siminovitchia fortis]|uniref:IclR family transcriptional regulator n=1 Tax=Siminovitchia fortis TaxID=254758 RepID=A0A443IWR7_9BACI|nr:IclR family transcriptional regulator [Siminovitchia fortis]RWR12623.1 IclR family transcriptional regulator [Siminovitchia fortis]WHY81430.1 IclR family transcriptional regulator [Siminovitchia fortis]
MNKNKGSLVAERTLKALMLFSKKKYLSVAEIAASLEISLPAAYRLVESLNNTGFIKREQSKEYSLDAPNILQLYNMVEQDLREVARPIIKKLASELRESVYLSVVHSDNSYYSFIEAEDSPSAVKWSENIGKVYSLSTGTAGKTHLAYITKDFSDSDKDAFISKLELKKYTENSLVSVEKLKKSLEKILNDGYCYTKGEHLQGVVGISVPVFNFQRTNVVAVLSTFMPDSHFDESELKNYVAHLTAGANEIGNSIP